MTMPKYYSRSLLMAIVIAVILVTFGWIVVSGVGLVSIAGAYAIILLYSLYIVILLPKIYRADNAILRYSFLAGVLAGLVFITEILLEYIILPENNSVFGLVEYGAVAVIFLVTSIVFMYRVNQLAHTLLTALTSAVIGSLIWIIVTLFVFYVFRGTGRQELVFRAEGNYQDFASSGMANFDVFILEDFYGAVFFHSLILPLIAVIVGLLGGGIGKVARMLKRPTTTPV